MSQKIRSLTGDRPTGPLHLGHYVGSLQQRVRLQETADLYVMIADGQALTDNFAKAESVTANVLEVARDYFGVGIDFARSTVFIQSQVQALCELMFYYLNLVSLGRLKRNPTVKHEIEQKGFGGSIPMGFLCYPISQTADITAFDAQLVPVGADQVPMIEQANEIVRAFNHTYGADVLCECKAVLSEVPRLSGIDGGAKASKSLRNCIYLCDDDAAIKEKVWSMYTDPNHIHVKDPGQVDGNVVFEYLSAFHPNNDEVEQLKAQYKKGGLGDVTIKNLLTKTLCDLLRQVRERRSSLSDEALMRLLMDGTARANDVANATLHRVRSAIGLNYWSAS